MYFSGNGTKADNSKTSANTSVLKSSPLNEVQSCAKSSKPSQNVNDFISIDSEESSLDSLPSVSGIGFKKKTSTSDLNPTESVLKSVNATEKVETLSLFERLRKSQLDMGKPVSADSQDSSSQQSINSISSMGSSVSTSLPTPSFVLRPGQFEIVLCVDNAEFYGM